MADETKAAPTAPPESEFNKIEDLVELWFRDHFPNSVVSRAGSEVWNLVHGAKESLKERLRLIK